MIDGDDPVDGLVPIGDHRVTAFRRWLGDADKWRSIQAERDDQEAAYDEAGALIGRFRDLAIATPFPVLAGHRMATEWDKAVVNPEWPESAANERRMALALSRGLLDFGPAASSSIALLLAADLTMRAEGSPPLIGAKIPPTNRHGYNPWLMDIAKAQTIRLAHYNAGREGSNWRAEHQKIYPDLSDDTRKVWNALVDNPSRRDCRRVGKLVRRKGLLTLEDAVIQLEATRYEAAVLREWIRRDPD
jgi:hypothetical protein